MDKVTINKVVKIRYVSLNFTTGLTDLVLTVRKPNGDILTPAPAFTEIGTDGVYEASYTPDALGVWQDKISSAINGDLIVRSHEVVAYDILDVKATVDVVEGKVDDVQTAVDATKVVVDATKVVVDDTKTVVDATKVVVDATKVVVDDTKTVVDATKTVVDSTKTVVDSIETKTDALQADITEIKEAIDNLPFNRGGYFA